MHKVWREESMKTSQKWSASEDKILRINFQFKKSLKWNGLSAARFLTKLCRATEDEIAFLQKNKNELMSMEEKKYFFLRIFLVRIQPLLFLLNIYIVLHLYF